MRYFINKFLKIAKRQGALRLNHPLTFDDGDLKLHDLVKLCFFQTDYDEFEL